MKGMAVAKMKKVEPLSPRARGKVDEFLVGCKEVREGGFDFYFIEDLGGIKVTKRNVDKVERDIRQHFAPYYPEIAR